MVFCSSCGKQLAGSSKFCEFCGAQLGAGGAGAGAGAAAPAPAKRVESKAAYRPPVSAYKAAVQKKPIITGAAQQQSTFGGANIVSSPDPGMVKCGLAQTTYEKQPAWAHAERHKNSAGQYYDGRFRKV